MSEGLNEGFKAGSVIFELGVDQSGLKDGLIRVTQMMRDNANEAETIFMQSMREITNIIRMAEANMAQEVDKGSRKAFETMVLHATDAKHKIEDSFASISESGFKAYQKLMSDMKSATKLGLDSQLLSNVSDLKSSHASTSGLLDNSRFGAQSDRLDVRETALMSQTMNDAVRSSLAVLQNEREQLSVRQELARNAQHQVEFESQAAAVKSELLERQYTVERQLAQKHFELTKNGTDATLRATVQQLELEKFAIEQHIMNEESTIKLKLEEFRLNDQLLKKSLEGYQAESKSLTQAEKRLIIRQKELDLVAERSKNFVQDTSSAHDLAIEEQINRLHAEALVTNKQITIERQKQADLMIRAAEQERRADLEHGRALRDNQLLTARSANRVTDIDEAHQLAAMENLSRAFTSHANGLANVKGGVDSLSSSIKASLLVMGGKGIYDWLIGTDADYQRTVQQIGLLINDVGRAQTSVASLKKIAFETPYTLLDLTKTESTLASTSMYISQIEDLVPRLAALARGNKETLTQVTKATMDISNAGKVMGQEMNQLKDAGVPIIPEMARTMQMTVSQMRKKLMTDGIDSQVYFDTIKRMTDEGGKYYGLLDKFSKDYKGRLEQVKGEFIDFGMQVGDQALQKLSDGLAHILENIEKMKKNGELKKVIDEWSSALKGVATLFLNVGNFLATHPGLVEGAIKFGILTLALTKLFSILTVLIPIFESLAIVMSVVKYEAMATSVLSLGAAFKSLGTSITTSMTTMLSTTAGKAGAISLIVGELVIAYDTWVKADKEIIRAIENQKYKREVEAIRDSGAVRYLNDVEKQVNSLEKSYSDLGDTAKKKSNELQLIVRQLYESDNHFGKMTKDQLAEQNDMIKKLRDGFGIDSSSFKFDADGKISNLKEVFSSIQLSDAIKNSILSPLKDALEIFKMLYEKDIDGLAAAGNKKLTASNFKDATGRDLAPNELKSIEDQLKTKNLAPTLGNVAILFRDMISKAVTEQDKYTKAVDNSMSSIEKLQSVGQAAFGDLTKSADDSFKKMEMLNRSVKNIGDQDINVVMQLNDSDLQSKWKEVQGQLKTGADDVSSRFTDMLDFSKLMKGGGDPSVNAKSYETAYTNTINAIQMAFIGGELTITQAQDSVNKVTKKFSDDMFAFGKGVGGTTDFSDQLVTDLNKHVTDAMTNTDKVLKGFYDTWNNRAISIGVEMKARGFTTDSVVKDVLTQGDKEFFNDELRKKNEEIAKLKSNIYNPTASVTPKTPKQAADEAYSTVSHEFELSMISLEQYQQQAKAIRDKYFKAGTADYLDFTKKIQDLSKSRGYEDLKSTMEVDLMTTKDFIQKANTLRDSLYSKNTVEYKKMTKDIEDAAKSHQDNLASIAKKGLDRQLKLSEDYIKLSIYNGLDPQDTTLDAFNRVKARENQAYAEHKRTEEDRISSIEKFGAAAEEAQYKNSEKWIKQQEKLNSQTYMEMIANWERVAEHEKAAFEGGLIDELKYKERMEAIHTNIMDVRTREVSKYMTAFQTSAQKGYDAATKAVNDYYDAIDDREKKADRKKRLDELLILEQNFLGATNKGGKDRLKQIQDEIKQINKDAAKEARDEEKKGKLDDLKTNYGDFQDAFKFAMDNVSKYAEDTGKTVEEVAKSMIKNFGSINFPIDPRFNGTFTDFINILKTPTAPVTNYNTFSVKNTSDAHVMSNNLGGLGAITSMGLGFKK